MFEKSLLYFVSVHQTRSDLSINWFNFFFFLLSFLTLCLSWVFFFFFFFGKILQFSKSKGKPPHKTQSGMKGQRFCLSHPSHCLPILSFCLKQSAVLTGVGSACLYLFFLSLAGTGKTCKGPKKRTEFPPQLIFIRNTINNTWHFNKTLSEWFNEKQIHYVRNQ